MKIIKNWPGDEDLQLEDSIKQALIKVLTDPFSDKKQAKSFWVTYGNSLIVCSGGDCKASLLKHSEEQQQHINFALSYPEFIEELSSGYKLSLTIFTDEGAGCYILYAPKCKLLKYVGVGI